MKKQKETKRNLGLRVRRGFSVVLLILGLIAAGTAYILRERFVLYSLGAAAGLMLLLSLLLALRKRLPFACILTGILCAALLAVSPSLYHTVRFAGGTNDAVTALSFTSVPGNEVRLFKNPETADVTDSGVTEFSFLKKMPTLKRVDARGNEAFDEEVFESLSAAMPDTEFVYTHNLGGALFDSDAKEIDLTDYPKTPEEIEAVIAAYPDKTVRYTLSLWGESIPADGTAVTLPENGRFDRGELDAALRLMPGIKTVDLSATMLDADSILNLLETYPEIDCRYRVILWSEGHSPEETVLTLPENTVFHADELDDALRCLPNVKTVDMTTASVDDVTCSIITAAHPDIEFIFEFEADGVRFRSDIERLKVEGELREYSPYFAFMPHLKIVDLNDEKVSAELMDGLIAENPGIQFEYNFSMFGVTVNSLDKRVVLDGNTVPSAEKFESYLKYLPNLEAVSMCNCGLSNQEMAALRERHPDIKIVWKLKFGHYTLRTDATMFSTALRGDNTYGYTEKTFDCLRYCTDLKFLDLGHNRIVNIDFIAGMTDLRVLILACNKIEDISVLKNMNDLEYVELFTNHIKDFSPLANKTKLLDLNINRNKIRSIAPIKTCTSLERLWVGSCGLTDAEVKELRAHFPKAEVNVHSGDYATTEGWREHKRYKVIKEMYSEKKYIPFD